MLKGIRSIVALAPLALTLAACDSRYATPTQGEVRVLLASPDAPTVSVLLNSYLPGETSNLDYADGTVDIPLNSGTVTVEFQANTPSGPQTIIPVVDLDFQANTEYTVVAEGLTAANAPSGEKITAVTYSRPFAATVAAGSTSVWIVHAAPAAGAVSVYVTAPGASLAGATPLGGGPVSYQGAIGPVTVTSGSYEIRITPSGSNTVIFDSGTIALASGADLFIAAEQNTAPTGPKASPIFLSVLDSAGNNSRIYDDQTPSDLRMIHGIANGPAVNFYANEDFAAPLNPTPLTYQTFTDYLPETPAAYTLQVVPAASAPSLANSVINAKATLAIGTYNSAYALGVIGSATTPPIAFVTTDDTRRLGTLSKLRVIHGSPTAGPVDIYLTAPGAGIAGAEPSIAALTYPGDTGFTDLDPGNYDVTVTVAGKPADVLISATPITLVAGGLYTALASDAPGGGPPYGLVSLDDAL